MDSTIIVNGVKHYTVHFMKEEILNCFVSPDVTL